MHRERSMKTARAQPVLSRRALLAMSAIALVVTACAASGGREIHSGVRYYAIDESAESERWSEGYPDIPIYVITVGNHVTGGRALAVRDALQPRHDLFRIVMPGDIHGDTLGEVLWRPGRNTSTECVSMTFNPGDSITPASRSCNRQMTSSSERWQTVNLQRTAYEAGGNAVLLFAEDYAGTFRGLRGYVLRCRGSGSGRPCG